MTLLSYLGFQALLVLSTLGIGSLIAPRHEDFPRTSLLGFSAILGLMPLLHLILPMRSVTGTILAGAAVLGGLWLPRQPAALRTMGGFLVVFLLVQVILVWPLAMNIALHYDWGLYYQQVQKWAATCPVVPGLGNLHTRFAFPGANFLFAGLLDHLAGPFWGARLLGGYLVGLAISVLLWGLTRSAREGSWFGIGFGLAALFLLTRWIDGSSTAVAAPDLISGALLLLLADILLRGSRRHEPPSDVAISILVSGLVVLKLSNLPFAVLLLVALLLEGWRPRPLSLLVIVPIATGWLVHNWVSTGYPVFPYGWPVFETDWAMTPDRVRSAQEGIRGWARAPGQGYLDAVAGWDWLPDWFASFRRDDTVLTSVALALGGLLAFVIRRGDAGSSRRMPAVLMATSLAALAVWFLAAPDVRFALGGFWILGAVGGGLALEALPWRTLRLAISLATALSLLPWVLELSQAGVTPLQPRVDLVKTRFPSGLEVYMPSWGDQVWNAPLPATPEVSDLHPRGASLCDGFRDGSRHDPRLDRGAARPGARPDEGD